MPIPLPYFPEEKIKQFQMVLSMAGITANQMTAELLYTLSKVVDERGLDFNLREAMELSEGIKAKYNSHMGRGAAGPLPPMPESLPMRHDDGK